MKLAVEEHSLTRHDGISINSLPESLRLLSNNGQGFNWTLHRISLRKRYVYISSILYRPFIYLLVHHKQQLPSDKREAVLTFADKAIQNCIAMNDGYGLYCRDEDSWYTCRLAFAHILTIEAAIRGGVLAQIQADGLGFTPDEITRAKRVYAAVIEHFAPDAYDLDILRCTVYNIGVFEK